jgi:hypothetical protein
VVLSDNLTEDQCFDANEWHMHLMARAILALLAESLPLFGIRISPRSKAPYKAGARSSFPHSRVPRRSVSVP